ncbi:MAG TPA: hypothetical protein VKK31_21385 [Thermoanaerobaculia bacterium]|nr:hypothetical protein [Thermoanaerobaculia bacterium]
MAKLTETQIVQSFFEAIGIKRLVYVDDQFGVTPERILDLCRGMSDGQIAASEAFPNFVAGAGDLLRERRILADVGELAESQLRKTFNLLAAINGSQSEQDHRAATVFSGLIGGVVDLQCLSRAEWKAQEAKLAAEANNVPTLFIFDEDFGLEGYPKDEGRRLIANLNVLEHGRKYAYALLTHNARSDDDENRIEGEIGSELPDLQGLVIVIAKERLTDEPQRFVHRLKSALLLPLFRVVKGKLGSATSSAAAEAMKQIEELKVDAFEQIVFGSSQIEGAWSPETLVRIFSVFQERHVRNELRGDPEVHGAVADADPLCGLSAGSVSSDVSRLLKNCKDLKFMMDRKLIDLICPWILATYSRTALLKNNTCFWPSHATLWSGATGFVRTWNGTNGRWRDLHSSLRRGR